jgi:FKBP-type peptidyl-prolyl cis-trans isomerase FkpA
MTSTKNRVFAGLLAFLFIFTSSAITIAVVIDAIQQSKKDPAKDSSQISQNPQENKNMLKGNPLANFTPISNIPELRSEDTTPGTGEEVQKGDTLTVDYTGALAATGIVFESSKDSGQRATFGLDQVIKGWTDAIPGMKTGGTRRLFIPADLAYGSRDSGTIPANSDLVFDVTVYETKR